MDMTTTVRGLHAYTPYTTFRTVYVSTSHHFTSLPVLLASVLFHSIASAASTTWLSSCCGFYSQDAGSILDGWMGGWVAPRWLCMGWVCGAEGISQRRVPMAGLRSCRVHRSLGNWSGERVDVYSGMVVLEILWKGKI